jgi:predicted AlkP superfamily pyrophosphatase or phosphodiesterase
VGHTTIGTGTFPYHHGIVQNSWYDRDAGKSVTCTEDSDATEISYGELTGRGESAHRMLTPSLAETLKAERNGRVVTMSLKARSAIGLAGHHADSVTWLDDRGAWATSSAFASGRAPWAIPFIAANPITRDAGKTWERLLPLERYRGPDDGLGEGHPRGWATTFPHALGPADDRAFYGRWMSSPYADAYVEEMAEAAIDANRLGHGDGIDFLGVSFSTNDIIGHSYGPASHEIQDELARLDGTIGKLLDHLDEKVGQGRYVLALSADHGVAEIPDQVAGGGRVLGTVLTGAIDAVLGQAGYGEKGFVAATSGTDIYFKPGIAERLRADRKTRAALVAAITKLSGVARVLTADQVNTEAARRSTDAQIRAAALSYFPGRSGDLLVIPKPNWIMGGSVTTHGTTNAYDQRVPVIFFGGGIRPGARREAATPADIAPTLAAAVGLRLRTADGHPLTSALRK